MAELLILNQPVDAVLQTPNVPEAHHVALIDRSLTALAQPI
jgi:hypothetical protein